MKRSPTTELPDIRFDDAAGMTSKTDELIHKIRTYQMDMQDWMWDKLQMWERRYSRHDRDGDGPWPGSSDVWLPLSDLYVGQIKPMFMNMLFGGPRVSTMKPLNSSGYDSAPAAAAMMEHIMRGGGVYGMMDLEQQMSMAVDSMANLGLGLVKSSYDYRTRISTETLRKDSLRGILGMLSIEPRMSEAERRQEQARFSGQQVEGGGSMPNINPPAIVQFFGEPVNPMNAEVFNRHAKRIKSEVVRLYNLDIEEKADAAACADIMEYLKSGTKERTVAITHREVIHDGPVLTAVPIQNLIVPPGALLDLSRAESVTHRITMTESELRQAAADNDWTTEAVDRALEGSETGSGLSSTDTFDEFTWAQQERIRQEYNGRESDTFEIWETVYYDDITERGLPEMVRMVLEPNSGAVLKSQPFPHDHGEMPWTALAFEINEPWYRSPRGVSEILDDIESHVSGWHRHLENNMTISTSTTMAVRRGVFDNPNDISIFPGLVMEVDEPQADIAPIVWPQTDIPIQRLEQFYMLWPERLIGGIDNQNLLDGGAPERRTATEVNSTESSRQRLVGMRGTLFLNQMRKPLNQLWKLYKQHGPREVFVNVTGEDPQIITQSATNGEYDVTPVASVGNMDPVVRGREAAQRLQEALQLQPLIEADPRYDLDLVQVWIDKVMLEDPIAASRMVKKRAPEQQQQVVQQQQAEAQRLAQIKDLAIQAMENAPLSPEQGLAILEEIGKLTGRKELQLIVQAANQAQATAENSQAVSQ